MKRKRNLLSLFSLPKKVDNNEKEEKTKKDLFSLFLLQL